MPYIHAHIGGGRRFLSSCAAQRFGIVEYAQTERVDEGGLVHLYGYIVLLGDGRAELQARLV